MNNKFDIGDEVIYIGDGFVSYSIVYKIEWIGEKCIYMLEGSSDCFDEEDLFALSMDGVEQYYAIQHKEIEKKKDKMISLLKFSQQFKF